MSELYTSEPPTSGKVIVETNYGNIDIELFTLEAPKSCRNFIQHCLNKYYNGCIFFKIFKNFMIQTGDPTNTGNGGESIYSEDFRDELHSRLKFSHRGIVAMANKNKPNTNGSQFFITLDKCPEMDKIYTIFGKVTGPTFFNAVTISNLSANKDGVPSMKDEEKPKITNTEVVINPFKDLKPTTVIKNDSNNTISGKKSKKKKRQKKLKIKYSPNKMFIQDIEDEDENKDNKDNKEIKEKDVNNMDEDKKEEKEEKNEIKEEEDNEEGKLNDNNNKETKENKEQLEENENKENIEEENNNEKIEDNKKEGHIEQNEEIKEKNDEENNNVLEINKETENNVEKDEESKNEDENSEIKDEEDKEVNEDIEEKDVDDKEDNENNEDKDFEEKDGDENNEENGNSDESESKSLSSDDHEVKNAKETLVDEEENIRKNKKKNIEDYKKEINLLRKKVKKEKEEVYNDEELRKKIEEEKVNKMNILQRYNYYYVKANQANKLSNDERAIKLQKFKNFIEGGDSERWYKTKLKFQTDSQKAFTLDMINKELEKNGNGNADDNI